MDAAIREAQQCGRDVPVGCVIVKAGKMIGRGHNTREQDRSVFGHAEMAAIAEACRFTGDWRLSGADLYVTLEPCPMCAGAIRAARISRVYFGLYDKKEGAAGTVWNLLYPDTEVFGGILAEACGALLSRFFTDLRQHRSGLPPSEGMALPVGAPAEGVYQPKIIF